MQQFKAYFSQDVEGKLLAFFNTLLKGEASLPSAWKRAKVILLPKVPKPGEPGELRPICLSPVLSKIYGRMIMVRVADLCPPYQVGQFGCRENTQTIDGIFVAETVVALTRRAHNSNIHMAKLDIRAAFDSLAHSAIVQYLRQCRAGVEVTRLWELVAGNQLTMSLGGHVWDIPVQQGVMQGSSYSADLFGRVIDWHLRGLPARWTEQMPGWRQRVDLPHLLLYADDLLLFASSPSELQHKFRDIVSCLGSIGLTVNIKKCKVLNVDGATPAVFPQGSCVPLEGQDRLLFLGLPIAHTNAPEMMLSHSLRKMSSAYHAMRHLLNQPQTPHRVKALLFQSYITSKWSWGCGAIWPTVRALKSVEGLMHSLMLGIFRFTIDPFSTWLENTKHRRRAVRLYCQVTQLDSWGVVWLKRVWTYLGHVARCRVDTPLPGLVLATNSRRLALGGLRPSWLSETIAHKLRLRYQSLCQPGESQYWESQAQNREGWANMLPRWIASWNADLPCPDTTSFLGARQLVLVEGGAAGLRPTRYPPEAPYTQGLVQVRCLNLKVRRQVLLWLVLGEQGSACLFRFQKGVPLKQSLMLHFVVPRDGGQDMHVRCLVMMARAMQYLSSCGGMIPFAAVVPRVCLAKSIIDGHVSGGEGATLANLAAEVQLFERLSVPPKKPPVSLKPFLQRQPAVVPRPYTAVLMTAEFANARYFDSMPSAALLFSRPELLG